MKAATIACLLTLQAAAAFEIFKKREATNVPEAYRRELHQATRKEVVRRATRKKRDPPAPLQSGVLVCDFFEDPETCAACGGTSYPGPCDITFCCLPPASVTDDGSGGTTCCDPQFIYTSEGTQTCCNSAVVDGECTSAPPPSRKRGLREAMSTIPGQHRTMLNADLATQYLRNVGRFSIDGVDYRDEFAEYGHTRSTWKSKFAIQGMKILKPWVGQERFKAYIADKYGKTEAYPLSPTYAMFMDDLPEIYHNLVTDPTFEYLDRVGHKLDRDALYDIISPHPLFNATVHGVVGATLD